MFQREAKIMGFALLMLCMLAQYGIGVEAKITEQEKVREGL